MINHQGRFSVLVHTDQSGKLLTMDGVQYQGKLWLVPQWRVYPGQKAQQPMRMIRFDNLPHSPYPPSGHDYLLDQQLPASVLDGSSAKGFDTLEGSEITFAFPILSGN